MYSSLKMNYILLFVLADLGMSASGSQTLKRSDMQCKLKDLLHSVEKVHKADIQTYSSGHLGPNSLTHKPLYCKPHKPNRNKPKCKGTGPRHIQERTKMEADVKETINALHSFTIAPKSQESGIQKQTESSSSSDLTEDAELAKHRKAKQDGCAVSDTVETGCCWDTHSQEAGLSWRDRLRQRQRFDMQVLRTKDLTTRKCLSGSEAARRHEHKLQQVRITDREHVLLPQSSFINLSNINGQISRCFYKCGLFP